MFESLRYTRLDTQLDTTPNNLFSFPFIYFSNIWGFGVLGLLTFEEEESMFVLICG